jgi:endonuclease VIII
LEGVPEGDTVWNTAQILQRGISGQVLTRSDFRVPQLAAADLSGATVVESVSRGKHLLLRLARPDDERITLHSHLRMDGAWRVFAEGEPWRGRPAHLIRVALHATTAVAVGFHLHELALVRTEHEHRVVGHLGPDLLGDDWNVDEAVRRLRERPDRAIADALIDQRNLAGIGNLYRAETLFLRGVSPWAPAGDVAELPEMVTLAQRLLASNKGRWTQATTGSLRKGEQQWVFQRAGKPCRRCGTTIRRWTGGDHERITYWCPTCQPGDAPAGTARPTLARD